MTTVTQWFDPKKNPVRIGFYQRDYPIADDLSPDFWDGSKWYMGLTDGIRNRLYHTSEVMSNTLPWRGLAENPNGRSA
jgi:hypothetical protein